LKYANVGSNYPAMKAKGKERVLLGMATGWVRDGGIFSVRRGDLVPDGAPTKIFNHHFFLSFMISNYLYYYLDFG